MTEEEQRRLWVDVRWHVILGTTYLAIGVWLMRLRLDELGVVMLVVQTALFGRHALEAVQKLLTLYRGQRAARIARERCGND